MLRSPPGFGKHDMLFGSEKKLMQGMEGSSLKKLQGDFSVTSVKINLKPMSETVRQFQYRLDSEERIQISLW